MYLKRLRRKRAGAFRVNVKKSTLLHARMLFRWEGSSSSNIKNHKNTASLMGEILWGWLSL